MVAEIFKTEIRDQKSEVRKNGTRIEALIEVRQHVGEMRKKDWRSEIRGQRSLILYRFAFRSPKLLR